ncbi:MAG TPA: 30S ribosomal protein S17 [Rhodanobacteraceae bacterium]|jgi:small subunit ribosomal protein S17|nr:30S ribosomal protein S17 [Rhodanobacteraceae bacterium]
MNDTNKSARTIDGRVSSAKSAKTITVVVDRQGQHGLYGKLLRRSTKLHAHDEKGECREGDLVRIAECRPLSKTKHFRVVEVLARAAD